VGNSGRVGTAEGVATDEVLVTTTDEVLVTTTDEVLVTTETTTTKVFGGRGITGTLLSTTSNTVETGREVVDTTFTPTGKCKNVSGPQPQSRG